MNNKKNNIILVTAIILLIILISFLIIRKINNKEYNLQKVTFEEIKEKINSKEDLIIILSQSTCSHCASYKPIVKQVVKKYKMDNVYYLDYDKEEKENIEEVLKYFNFDGGTPTTFFYKEGKEVSILKRLVGETTESKVIDTFKKLEYIK